MGYLMFVVVADLTHAFPIGRSVTPSVGSAHSVERMERYLVDGMNVIGSRPDGWWRDLDAAVVRLASSLAAWQQAEDGDVTVVFDGRRPPALDDVDLLGLGVAFAGRGREADDELVRRVGTDPDPGSLTVVTSDRLLGERVRAAGAKAVAGSGGFRRMLDRYC
jgi:predicted RNA-binding protein with PIN domain